jgi:hypothetical protein
MSAARCSRSATSSPRGSPHSDGLAHDPDPVQRQLAAAGADAAAVLVLVGAVLPGQPPAFNADPLKIVAFFHDNHKSQLVGAVLIEINDEWATQNRYMQLEPMSELVPTIEGEAAPTEPPLVPSKAA